MTTANLSLKADYSKIKPIRVYREESGVVEAAERTSPPENFSDREGYDPDFIEGWSVPFPLATGITKKDMAKLKGSNEVELKYQHFSIVMSKRRKLPMATATNIDGGLSVKITRDNDQWFIDGRIDRKYQYGIELYKNNRLDRGHMVRREDPVWGNEAETANEDTFHYTNSCPQMDNFNQKEWLGLENYILKNARVDNMRISVFTGPVFSHSDLNYEYNLGRFALIPSAYWKVIAFLTDNGRPCATAYKLSQDKELSELEFVFGRYKTYQISVRQVMEETNLDFEALLDYDAFSSYEEQEGVRIKNQLTDLEEIQF